MATASASIDQSLRQLTDELAGRPGTTHHVAVGRDLASATAQWIVDVHPERHHVVVCDAHTADAAGRAIHAAFVHAGADATLRVLDPPAGEDHVVCDDAAIEALQTELAPQTDSNAVAVGAGTINDIVKMATFRLKRPYQSSATAASMNGYTSAIAAVLSRGVKRTLPTWQAEAVFADVDVIAAAPSYLNQAGFGDLLSKPYSHADWLLSHLVRGVEYEERPARLLDTAYDALVDAAAEVNAATAEGIGLLTRTILLSGFTMAIAGTSAPASGGEHLVSHYWDMEQHCREQPLFGLHGTQVGIATRLSAMLFERLAAVTQNDIDPDAAATRRPDDAWLADLTLLHPRLTAPVVEEVREQIVAKQRYGARMREEIADVRDRWPEISARMREVLLPASRMTEALQASGAADRPSAIGVGRDHAVATLRVCRQIRNRYVALDLLDDLGLLHDAAAEVVDAAEA